MMSTPSRALFAFLALLLAAGAALAQPVLRAPQPRPPYPAIQLVERQSQGQRAIDLLGGRLPEVAAWYKKSPEEFTQLLLRDRRLRIDQRGRLFVEETLDYPLGSFAETTSVNGALNGQLAPLDQSFLLHSKPGAERTIYLNFRGKTLSGTAWNGGGTSLIALPFDTDGLPYSNTQAELERIQYIWQRVAEDFAPFDVDVTTEAPPPGAITRSGSSDSVFGTEVLVTSRSGVYSCNCGGVAYISVFDDTSDFYKPALVFYDALGPGNEKYVAEAISHEAGHNLGLLHDGWSGGGYYQGHGSGATGWAPIMGVGYSRALVQWSKGEYSTANNVQDDYAVMSSNGMPVRADDHGSTLATATVLAGTDVGGVTSLAVTGIVERPSDIDVFRFAAGAGAASFTLAPAVRSANLDARLELRDAAGTLLASANPSEALDATLATSLPAAGVYYLSVMGVGKGDPLTTGYSNYGSLGQYALAGSVLGSTTSQPPVAAITATPVRGTVPLTVGFSSAGSSDPDGSIVGYEWRFGDGSPPVGGSSASHTYNSAGSFTAELRVTDNSGLTASRSTTITVDPQVALPSMRVADIAMSLKTMTNGSVRAVAVVAVRDASGRAVRDATVTGTWSGLVAGDASVATSNAGNARFASPTTRATTGTFVFTVTGIALSGYQYQPATNTETSDSIAR